MAGKSSRSKSPNRTVRRLWRYVIAAVVILLLSPIGLILLYRQVPPPITPLMVIRLFEGEGVKKDWVPLEEISSNLIAAVIASEDNNFCSHSGIDWGSTFEALSDHYKGKKLRGASTVSMQTTKNLVLWPGRDVVRKAIEAPLTLLLEYLWPKRRIMEVYLNIIEWGPGIYGAEAAARAYFGRSAAKLTRRQAALMAAVLPNPRRWSPARPTSYIQTRAYRTVNRMNRMKSQMGCAVPRSRLVRAR